jgi:hypothetical protein
MCNDNWWCNDDQKCLPCMLWYPADVSASISNSTPPDCAVQRRRCEDEKRRRSIRDCLAVNFPPASPGCTSTHRADRRCTCATLQHTLQRLDAHMRRSGVCFKGGDGENEGGIEGSSSLAEATYLCQRTAAAAEQAARDGRAEFRVCQTGFNRGRSAAAFLSAHASVRLTSFDLGHWYGGAADDWIRASFVDADATPRHSLFWGNSARTLPRSVSSRALVNCDLVFVDGNHLYDGAMDDVKHFGWVSRPGTPLLLDDCPSMMGHAFLSACEHNLLDCAGAHASAWRGAARQAQDEVKQICEGRTTAAANDRHSDLPQALGSARRAQAVVADPATERGVGFCNATWRFSDCDHGQLGSWALSDAAWLSQRTAEVACVRACLGCDRCGVVSVSARRRECSWFAQCDMRRLQTLPKIPAARGNTFATLVVRT